MNRLSPSAYHDPKEVVWKHMVAQAYWEVLEILRRDRIVLADFDGLRFAFLRSFNSHHDVDLLCRDADAASAELLNGLNKAGCQETATTVAGVIARLRASLSPAMASLQSLRQVDRTQSYVLDGVVKIADKSAEEFAAHSDYIGATLELINEDSPEAAARARAAWRRGFDSGNELLDLVRNAVESAWGADDILAEILLREQRSGTYPSLQQYEYAAHRTRQENQHAKAQAIREGYYLLGKLMSCISLMNEGSVPVDAGRLDNACPVARTLRQAGISMTPARLNACRQFMLVHATHGLNPGEFTARIAASVRTTFPQALIASLMVRSGKLHAGALPECIQQIDDYLSAPSKQEFVRNLLRSSVLYGFGHRIHKRPRQAGDECAGGDPRVAFQVATARVAFPEMKEMISAIDEFATVIRRLKPALAPNTDFGAAVWFRCLGLSPQFGSALFTINRLPGLIAQVINQLEYKANALRPPLAVNLPYTV